jgi:hypothetical protein
MFSTKSPGISPNGARIRGRLAFAGLVSDTLDCGRAEHARTHRFSLLQCATLGR